MTTLKTILPQSITILILASISLTSFSSCIEEAEKYIFEEKKFGSPALQTIKENLVKCLGGSMRSVADSTPLWGHFETRFAPLEDSTYESDYVGGLSGPNVFYCADPEGCDDTNTVDFGTILFDKIQDEFGLIDQTKSDRKGYIVIPKANIRKVRPLEAFDLDQLDMNSSSAVYQWRKSSNIQPSKEGISE